MTTAERARIVVTLDQYTALLAPVRPPSALELFEYERAALADKRLASIEAFDHFAARLPASGLFVLVPPSPAPVDKLDWSELMARVELDGKSGRNFLTPQHLADLVSVPETPTMLVGVEDGRGRLNVRPSESRKAITAEGRHPYTAWRGYIHVVIFPEVLRHHSLDCVGSRGRAKFVSGFCLYGGEPTLNYSWGGAYAVPLWGAPSCGSVET